MEGFPRHTTMNEFTPNAIATFDPDGYPLDCPVQDLGSYRSQKSLRRCLTRWGDEFLIEAKHVRAARG